MLELVQKPERTGKLPIKTHFIEHQALAKVLGRHRLGADKVGVMLGDGFFVEVVGIIKDAEVVAAFDVIGGVFELAVNTGGFGVDDATVAPQRVGYFQDEMFLKDPFWFEFINQGVDELFVLRTVLGEMGGFENYVAGVKTVLDSVSTGNSFTFRRAWSG